MRYTCSTSASNCSSSTNSINSSSSFDKTSILPFSACLSRFSLGKSEAEIVSSTWPSILVTELQWAALIRLFLVVVPSDSSLVMVHGRCSSEYPKVAEFGGSLRLTASCESFFQLDLVDSSNIRLEAPCSGS